MLIYRLCIVFSRFTSINPGNFLFLEFKIIMTNFVWSAVTAQAELIESGIMDF